MFRPYFLKNNSLSSFFGLLLIISLATIFTNAATIIFITLFNICFTDNIIPFNFITLEIGSLIQFLIAYIISKFIK